MRKLFLIFMVIVMSCNDKTTLPDPLAAGWKGESVCEMIHEDQEVRVLKMHFCTWSWSRKAFP